jgi:hypothetical protein
MSDANSELVYELLFRPQGEPGMLKKERVVLLRRLDSSVNANIPFFKNILVDKVNDRTIDSLEDLVRAIEENRAPYHVFEFGYFGRVAVLDRAAADKANAQILKDYGVAKDRNL